MDEFTLPFEGYRTKSTSFGIPNKSGVYVVYAGKLNKGTAIVEQDRIIYIGSSNYIRSDIDKRIKDHEWDKYFGHGEEAIFSWTIMDTSNLQQVESALVEKYKPVGNSIDTFKFPDTKIETSGENYLIDESFIIENEEDN